MNEEFVLNKLNSLMNCLRDCNVTVRWLMLHRKTSHEKLRQMMKEATNPTDILKLLLTCSEFENNFKTICSQLIERKQ
jgi:WASH complex subunit strumpellin